MAERRRPGEVRDAIVDVLDDIVAELQAVRSVVAGGDRAALLERLTLARTARLNLPTTAGPPEALTEILVGVSDRPGVLAEITTALFSYCSMICEYFWMYSEKSLLISAILQL